MSHSDESEHHLQTMIISEQTVQVLDDDKIPSASLQTSVSASTEIERNIDLEPERYQFLEVLGTGGMGIVIRVRDLKLNRNVAMKILHEHLHANANEKNRFLAEAQIEAQLQHPGIVSVHETGTLPSGQIYFTMQEASGELLFNLLKRRQSAVENRTALLQYLHRISEAVGYAHKRGVLHCDIKPSNIMIGAHGEIGLVDWGIARLYHARPSEQSVQLKYISRRQTGIIGTPLYMSPEQARGAQGAIQPASDVYALGIILYQILFHSVPYPSLKLDALLYYVKRGLINPFPETVNVPEPLRAICAKALSLAPKDRHQNGQEFAQDLADWLNGVQQGQKAYELLAEAKALQERAVAILEQCESKSRKAHNPIIEPRKSMAEKKAIWAEEDRMKAERIRGAALWRETESKLLAARTYRSDLPEVQTALVSYYHATHTQREIPPYERDRVLQALTAYTEELPRGNPQRTFLLDYIKGEGTVSLYTDPPGAKVTLERYEEQDRRLVPVQDRFLGQTPLVREPIAMGSYRLRIEKDGYDTVLYPVHIRRNQDWDGCPPGSTTPVAIWLPPKGEIDPDEVYIPAGYTFIGGDPLFNQTEPEERVWVDGYIIGKYPCTNQTFLEVLNWAVEKNHSQLREITPKVQVKTDTFYYYYGEDEKGHFYLKTDLDGDLWEELWPVISLRYSDVMAYLALHNQYTKRNYRLPSENEWVRAARGADLRVFPFGNFFDETWQYCYRSQPSIRTPTSVLSYPQDVSPFEVYGCAGNVHEMTALLDDGTGYMVRGGEFFSSGSSNRICKRKYFTANVCYGNIGFRMVRPLPNS